MGVKCYIARQLSRPDGFGGKFVSFFMNRQNRRQYEETIRQLAPQSPDSILDIGCGNGFVLNMIARRYDCTLTGIDISPSIIADALDRNRSYVEDGRMQLICRDMCNMPFAAGAFSKVYTINTVYFWEDLSSTIGEIWRILKPNGLLVNTLYTNEMLSRYSHTQYGYKQFAVEELTSAGVNAGFTVEVVSFLDGDAYCVLYRKSG